jgi:hypothetical protein
MFGIGVDIPGRAVYGSPDMNGTLPAVRERYGLSLRAIGRLIGKSAAAVMDKVHGDSPWHLSEAHTITAHIRQHHDPSATVEQLFGLPELPQSSEPAVSSGSAVEHGRGQRRGVAA